ncbi:MAG: hypothetical protein JXA54_16400 [Candidatus Heimdallarchaeota archaeon]|nr:hypothetical protein [Candidatus Heimdallarchaeota archaeon]
MPKEKIERSEAILREKRNTRKGLQMRNSILEFLFKNSSEKFTTREVADGTGYSHESTSYHLKNLLAENVVTKIIINRRNMWQITGLGQQTIKKWLEKNGNL